MARGKLQLSWIIDNSARKASLKKRRNGLVKKVEELSTLCGVGACVIIYSPGEPEPTVWPPFEKILQFFHRYEDVPEMKRCMKNCNMIEYLDNTLGKLIKALVNTKNSNDKLEKHIESVMVSRNSNEDEAISHLSFQIENGSRRVESLDMNETCKMMTWLENKLEEINIWERSAEVAVVADPVVGAAGGPVSGNVTCYDAQDPVSWDSWYHKMLSSASNVAGGSAGGSRGGGGGASGFYVGSHILNVMGQNGPSGFNHHMGGWHQPNQSNFVPNSIPNMRGQYGPNPGNSSTGGAGIFHGFAAAASGGVGAPQYGGIYGGASGYGHHMGGWQLPNDQVNFMTNQLPNVMGQYGPDPNLMNGSSSNAAGSSTQGTGFHYPNHHGNHPGGMGRGQQ